jgi:hypothetical protein
VAFPSKPLQRSAPSYRLWPVLAVGGVLVLGVALLAVVMPHLGPKAATPAPGGPPRETNPTLAGPGSEAPRAAAPAQPHSVATAPVAPAPEAPLAKRVARTWVNVRGGRGRAAPTVRILNPGEAVQVDSLIRGWYRVLIDGRAAGYAHRSNLDPVPPAR